MDVETKTPLMNRLTGTQLDNKLAFIKEYSESVNAATGSKLDGNANVVDKNIATLAMELWKGENIQLNRALMHESITNQFGVEYADKYLSQLESHEIYTHDETNLYPYCVSISMYPFILDGMVQLGGESKAPKHLDSFCGSFINLVFAISSQFAGAVATPEFLLYFDYFARLDYGDNYLHTHKREVETKLQHVVYSLNQPAAARGYQSAFWNVAIFDYYFLNEMFKDYRYPDCSCPDYASIQTLQRFFLTWLNKERERSLLTFPVVSCALLCDEEKPKDELLALFLAREMAEGNSFFLYQSQSVDSLASCCRLRNAIQENDFSYTLGAGGVQTGSSQVITINLNRWAQEGTKSLYTLLDDVHRYLVAHRKILEQFQEDGLLRVYDAGYITLEKQYLTVGISGLVEAAEAMGIVPGPNEAYMGFVQTVLKTIYETNRQAEKKYGYKFNCEFVPGESLGIKFAQWDKADGLNVPRDCYNSYLYPVESNALTIIDKFHMHGAAAEWLDGGSALHLNLSGHLTASGYYALMKVAAKTGCNYWTVNVLCTVCESCGHISKHTRPWCDECYSHDVVYATRVIGYLKKVEHFAEGRQHEHSRRYYH